MKATVGMMDNAARPRRYARFGSAAALVLSAVVTGAGCHNIEFGGGSAHCNSDRDCHSPYVCRAGACENECARDTDCAGGRCVELDSETRVCTQGAPGGGGAAGRVNSSQGGAAAAGATEAVGGTTGGTGGSCEQEQCDPAPTSSGGTAPSGGGGDGASGGRSTAGATGSGGVAPGAGGSLGFAGTGENTGGSSGDETAGAGGSVRITDCQDAISFEVLPYVPVGDVPCSIAIGDFDDDSELDLAVANCGSDNVSVLLGKGNGRFSDPHAYPVGGSAYSVTAGDLNHDGALDLVVTTGAGTYGVLMNDGKGSYSFKGLHPAGSLTLQAAIADFDGDGNVDLAIANESPELLILPGFGDGTFDDPVEFETAEDVAWTVLTGDFDGDHVPDVVLVGGGSLQVGLNPGNADFSSFQTVLLGTAYPTDEKDMAAADFDGDGDLDIAVAYRDEGQVTVFENPGDGSFVRGTEYEWGGYRGVATPDVDADGNPDLVCTGVYSGAAVVFLNRRPGHDFTDVVTIKDGNAPDAVVGGDLNDDGLEDFVLAYPNDDAIDVLLTHCGSR